MIFYIVLILRDVSKVVDKTEEVVDKVHKTVIQPLRALDFLMEKIGPYIEMLAEKKAKSQEEEEG